MNDTILSRLNEIEQTHHVTILYACESGSRAWGFPSADSDYDVRFIYLNPTEWYLSVAEKRDVIEVPIDDQLDINGWDLKKALQLFRKSNPPLLEWLGSPIVYMEKFSSAMKMRELAKTYYSPLACIHHYLHMAQGNYRHYLIGNEIWTKKYFYVLRPLLSILWIEAGYGVAPTSFGTLLERINLPTELKEEIQKLIVLKSAGDELAHGPRIPIISDYIEQELTRLENLQTKYKNNAAPYQELDQIFLDALAEVWG